jgi:hypothetical protein
MSSETPSSTTRLPKRLVMPVVLSSAIARREETYAEP